MRSASFLTLATRLCASMSLIAAAARAQCADWVTTFGPPSSQNGLNARAYDLVRWNDGLGEKLYAGGDFTQAGTASVASIAAWNGTSWNALGLGLNGSCFSLLASSVASGPLSGLFAGGNFTTAGGGAASCIARWNGSTWSPLGSGINGSVFALCLFNDGSGNALYAGGAFTLAGGTSVSNVAKWNGSTWSAVGTGTSGGSFGGRVDALTVYNDGSGAKLYAGGWFNTADSSSANLVACWNGTNWAPLGGATTYLSGTNVYDLCVYDPDGPGTFYGDMLYAGGYITNFTNFSSTSPCGNVVAWNGTSWFQLDNTPYAGADNVVRDLHVFDDGLGYGPVLYATGHFQNAGQATGSTAASLVARYDLGGWYPLGLGLGGGTVSLCLCDYDDDGAAAPRRISTSAGSSPARAAILRTTSPSGVAARARSSRSPTAK
jgi:hypothetical protein